MNQPERLLSSVKVRFLDGNKIIDELKSIAEDILKKNNNVLSIYLFGSISKGNYMTGSDADILVVLRDDNRRFIDRIPEFLRYFLNTSVATDVFPYTQKELERMILTENNFITKIWKEKKLLAKKE